MRDLLYVCENAEVRSLFKHELRCLMRSAYEPPSAAHALLHIDCIEGWHHRASTVQVISPSTDPLPLSLPPHPHHWNLRIKVHVHVGNYAVSPVTILYARRKL